MSEEGVKVVLIAKSLTVNARVFYFINLHHPTIFNGLYYCSCHERSGLRQGERIELLLGKLHQLEEEGRPLAQQVMKVLHVGNVVGVLHAVVGGVEALEPVAEAGLGKDHHHKQREHNWQDLWGNWTSNYGDNTGIF